jgi:helix-turn-helix, Psq domain
MTRAVASVLNGDMSLRKASEAFNVLPSSLQEKIHRRTEIKLNLGRKTLLLLEEDD